MKRIICLLGNEFMRADAHQHIRRFYTDYQIAVIHIFDHFHLVESALYDPLCRHPAIFGDQVLFKRTAVYANPDRDPPFFCSIYHRFYPVDASNVSGINTYFISTVFHSRNSQPVVEMDIRHQRDMNFLLDL